MRNPNHIVFVGVMILLATAFAYGQSTPQPATVQDLERVVNFDASIASLAELVRDQAYDQIDANRFFVLEGAVASTQIFDPNPETFQAVIELVESAWIGLEEIEVHHIYVLVEGPAYAARLPERLPRDPGPEIIRTNQELLVIGPFIGTAMLDATTEVAVIQAVAVR
ncbi:MAG: hypothetical protein ACOCY8_06970 [Spirochaetota bacterium]